VTQPETLDLNVIIADVRSLLSRSIGPHIDLRAELAPQLAPILADHGQIEQVLLNLAINARDAMAGGGVLTISTAGAEIDEDYAQLHPGVSPGRYVELTVSDTGTGMSAAVSARIFEPFFTTKPSGQATGLGLSTVHGIVAQAGGGMTVSSEEGAGTTLRLYFPASSAIPPAAAGSPAPDARGNGETILVVDDEPAVLDVTSRILRKNGYATISASNCEEALSLASSRDFQLLLTDSVMPGMSGATLAERITATRPGLRVVHMSGYNDGMLTAQDIRDGSLAFVQKPFTAAALLDTVRAALGTQPTGAGHSADGVSGE